MENEKCCRCKLEKPMTQFYKNKTRNDEFQTECSQSKTEIYFLNKEKTFPKITCSIGKTIYKCYLENHLKTKLHKSRLQEIPAVMLKSNFFCLGIGH
jgi:hypothetical protein